VYGPHSSGLKGNSVGMLETARENTAEWASHKISKLSLFWSNKEAPPPPPKRSNWQALILRL